ncbi:MAG: hypothetical protein Athens101428_515 [Candidatus Berkelbacteria bacterium Athens1014_28]|uniref:Uncharacterized protein n=1 Tax=Candidatus Berkelbacteria bacterium Athens1014_28 TaxID=2017145 RepID=A0A554LLX8_9BACT|nr:MAG: hypothetical protein Athens101428_515 [Candidatus Berkelbacteria bacterium Athens1014_28]
MSETHAQHFPHIIVGNSDSLDTLTKRAKHILNEPSRTILNECGAVVVRVLVTSAQEKVVEECGFQVM